MVSKKFTVTDDMGLHARPASLIADISLKYDCSIDIEYRSKICSAKSILNVLALAIPKGENFTIVCNGNDEENAISDLEQNVLCSL